MSEGLAMTCHRCLAQLASKAYFMVGLLASLALPLTMAFVGMRTIDDCPIQPMIPLYLLVGGAVGSVKVGLLLYDTARMRTLISKSLVIGNSDADEYPWRQNAHRYYVHVVLSVFLLTWFLMGNYWVFSIYPPDFIPPFHRPLEYCRRSVYVFAVIVLAVGHTVLLLLLVCGLCLHVCSRIGHRDDYNDADMY